MFYLAMYVVSVILKTTADILRNPAPDEPTVDAWIRQRARVREAIAQAKSKNAPAKSAGWDHEWPDDEWVNPWARQQTRLREALAQAKSKHVPQRSAD